MDGYGTVHAESEQPEWFEKCPECGGDCFQVDDQGQGLISWQCFDCHLHFQAQYELDYWDDTFIDADEELPF